MKILKLLAAVCGALILSGCVGTKFYLANRSVFSDTHNEATTSGTIDNKPRSESQSVAAEKQTDINTPQEEVK